MKAFIKRTLLFMGIVTGFIFVAYTLGTVLLRNKATFNINQDTKAIIVGHSHPECAYNDSLIQNFQNLAISGEAYYYTLPKLKKILEANEQIDLVFIEFTNNQLTEDINDWVWTDKYISYHYAIYAAYIDLKDVFLVFRNNPEGYIANLPIVFKNNLKKALSPGAYNIPSSYGGYARLTGNLYEYQKKMNEQSDLDEDFVEIDQSVSMVQIEYLQKILKLLKKKNVEVCLIRTPEHHSYSGFANEEIYKATLENYFSDNYYLDLRDFPLNEEHFRDPEHLNYLGANAVSKWLDECIKTDFFQIEPGKKHFNYTEISALEEFNTIWE